MDKEQLIADILQAVMERIREAEQEKETEEKPELLVLVGEDHTCSHCFTGDPDIAVNYKVTCSTQLEPVIDPEPYEEIIVRQLSTTDLVKLSSGIFDTPYLETISRAVFKGIKVTVILDDMDAFKYEDTAPQALLKMLNGKLDILRSWDIRIEKEACALSRLTKKPDTAGGYMPEKKVITESDLKKAYREGNLKLLLRKKTILTDMAKEYAAKHKMEIIFV